ncbi:hypothetical protein MLD38_027408 [Melastoma candidum]|uniref:Uncharacterized protein n=1 Tax=Melastoma candidum TaxID=119954 RepID=A0ACB9P2P3_9MYRT|nr:hypothetical protein MLD38_027408 [Melastoma candidum]
MEEEKDDPLASLPSVPPPPRKTLSYSQQLLPPVPSSTTTKRNQVRIHSLDENEFLHHKNPQYHQSLPAPSENDEDYDEGFCPRSTGSTAVPTAPSSSLDHDTLPVFVAAGGNTGVFKLPVRSSVHSSRPLCVELRPHPLKETQVGKFLRNLAYAKGQLWAGQENGVRYWNVEREYEPGGGLGGRIRRGDEDAAPFHESATTSPTMCLLVDCGSRIVWTGHKDGKVRSWKMDQGSEDTPFKEGLSWQAQRGPVLSIVMTSFGNYFPVYDAFSYVA